MSISTHRPFPAKLRCLQQEIEAHARRHGLDFFSTALELETSMLDTKTANAAMPKKIAIRFFNLLFMISSP